MLRKSLSLDEASAVLMFIDLDGSAKNVKVYRAEGLPNLNRGILAHIKKHCTIEEGVFIDPYVQIFFAGLKGSTSKKKRTTCPVWDEEVVFTTRFPLPPEPIVVQVRDDDFMANKDIGTAVIPLDKISSSDEHGFLPTFGPCYVCLRDQKHPASEDVSCNGRLLMAITTDIIEKSIYTKTSVQGSFGYDVEFFLFACVQDASMIDRRLVEMKEIRFSLQMGEEGREIVDADFDDHSVTPFMVPEPMDRQYLYLPFGGNKPCMWLSGRWPEDRKRMFISNILSKMEA
ncbi:unnamed protein product [Larinioides sclopetarius]|uniref:C2 domain-containing protein n=1 Tax=Larinioides sclopetarius TaxID=280406 RepID=A0AAV2BFS8_9ARAC